MNKKIGLLCAALAVAVGLSLWAVLPEKESGTTAVITKDGVLLHEVDLEDPGMESQTFHILGENGEENVVRVEHGRVCMESASCPDQVCVNQGYISDSALPIVCLPNKVIVTIEGGESDLDAATK